MINQSLCPGFIEEGRKEGSVVYLPSVHHLAKTYLTLMGMGEHHPCPPPLFLVE
jgi:hypothetical protein